MGPAPPARKAARSVEAVRRTHERAGHPTEEIYAVTLAIE